MRLRGIRLASVTGQFGDSRAAIAKGDWAMALELLLATGEATTSAEGLELCAQAAYGNGDFEDAVGYWEDLHNWFVNDENPSEAARAAAMVAMYLMMDTGLMAPVRGWLQRAERLLDGREDVPALAVIAMVRTYERFMCGDIDAARIESARAIELGERLDVPPAVVIGRVASARVKILDGNMDEGLAGLDEVAVLLMSGAVDPLTTGMMYCELICAAQGLALHDRATEWTEVMERWRHGAAIGGINGRCRVHRAELLRITGSCDEAEAEALLACEELRPWMRREFGWPMVELGTIRLRKGDLLGAEAAFVEAHAHAWSPQPGLALLRLAQDDATVASAMIADAIAHPLDVPSKERPPFGDLRMAPLLDAQVEIAEAVGDVETAFRATADLRAIADTYPSKSLGACAALAEGRTAKLEGDLGRAIERCGAAVVSWTEVGAPFEAARARVVLGQVHHQADSHALARMEWEAAKRAFDAFGARRWTITVASLLDEDGSELASPATSSHISTATFRLEGDMRKVAFGREITFVRDLLGFRYLQRLLADPDREFHVLDLVAAERGVLSSDELSDDGLDRSGQGPDGGIIVLDDKAREAYRRRLVEVENDIDEAASNNDLARVELAQRDREYLVTELSRAVGLAGRERTTGGSAERARTSVSRSLRYALTRLAEQNAGLAAHLERHVRTGTYCSYGTDSLSPIRWTV